MPNQLNKGGWQGVSRQVYISVALVAVIIGLLMTFQFRTTSSIEQGIPAGRAQELAVELRELEKDKSRLRAEINDLNDKLLQATKGQAEALAAIEGELAKAKLVAGLVTVQGPGIEITLDNPSVSRQTGERVSFFVIRDEDLLRVINELRGAGAEALSINGQRITARTEIRFAAPFININLSRVVPPYHILAIGKPENLKNAMSIPGGLIEYLQDLGIQVEIKSHDQLVIPAYTGDQEFHYARPA